MEERDGCVSLVVFLMSCEYLCSVALPHGANNSATCHTMFNVSVATWMWNRRHHNIAYSQLVRNDHKRLEEGPRALDCSPKSRYKISPVVIIVGAVFGHGPSLLGVEMTSYRCNKPCAVKIQIDDCDVKTVGNEARKYITT